MTSDREVSANYRRYYPAVEIGLFGLTIVLILLGRIKHQNQHEIVSIAGIFLFFFWPGWFMLKLLKWRNSVTPLDYIPLTFGLSFLLWHIAGLMAFCLKYSTNLAVLLSLAILYIPALILLFNNSRTTRIEDRLELRKSDIFWIVPAILCVLMFLAMVWPFRLNINTNYDSGYFLTIARKFSELDKIEIQSAHVYEGMVDRGYGLNAYLLSVGLLARLLNQDVLFVWGSISVYGLLVFVFAAYLLTARLFNSVRIGLAVMVFTIICHFSYYFIFPPCSYANPSMLTRPMALILLWVFTELYRNPNWRNRFAFGLLGASILSIHPFGLIVAFLYVVGALLMTLLFERQHERRDIVVNIILAGAVLLIAALPYLLLKYVHLFPSENILFSLKWEELHPNVQRYLLPLFTEDAQNKKEVLAYIAKPTLFFYGPTYHRYSWIIGWLGIPLLVILYLKSAGPSRFYAGMLLGGIILIVAISFNPWLFPYFAKIWTVDLVARISHRTPVHAIGIFGTLCVFAVAKLRPVRQKLKYSTAYLLLIMATVLGVWVVSIHDDFCAALKKKEQAETSFNTVSAQSIQNTPFLEAIRNNLHPGEAVFNTNGLAEIHLCPLVNIRVYDLSKTNWVCMNMDWEDHEKRQTVIRQFLESSGSDALEILHDIGMRYVVTAEEQRLSPPYFKLIASSIRKPQYHLYQANFQEL